MKNSYLSSCSFLFLLFMALSCESTEESINPEAKNILTAKPWFFFSINGGEGYDCVKQTRMTFHESGNLDIARYVREPDYTCSGPHNSSHSYGLLSNNTKIKLGEDTYTIKKLTQTEFVLTANQNGKEQEWVYLREE